MPSVRNLIAARRRDPAGLQALAVALHRQLEDVPQLPDDLSGVWEAVEERGAEAPDTWQEVRAAVDHGDLTEAEYDYLAAAVAALEDDDD